MQDYDPRRATRYIVSSVDFGGGADVLMKLKGPKGKKGWIADVGVYNVTEVFNGGTLMPGFRVGTIADDNAYINDIRMGAVAVNDGSWSLRENYTPVERDALSPTPIITDILPADTAFMVTWLAATGSGLTGQATAFIDVVWDP